MGDPNALGSLIGLWLFVAMFAAAFGSRGLASKVMAGPFHFMGWIMRGLLGAAGQGARAIVAQLWRAGVVLVSDAHRYCYGYWPGSTLLVYAGLFLSAIIWSIFLR